MLLVQQVGKAQVKAAVELAVGVQLVSANAVKALRRLKIALALTS